MHDERMSRDFFYKRRGGFKLRNRTLVALRVCRANSKTTQITEKHLIICKTVYTYRMYN